MTAPCDNIWTLGDLFPDVAARLHVVRSGCWEWSGPRVNGYGVFGRRIDKRQRRFMVHRYVWQRLVGPIPENYQIDHLCKNRRCANPDHLEPVTQQENIRRARISYPLPTHCPHGHPYTPDNIYVKSNEGRLRCRRCVNRHTSAYQRRRRLRESAERRMLETMGFQP